MAATSAERLAGEPGVDRLVAERAALGAAYCQRLTRALTVLAGPVGAPLTSPPSGVESPLRELSAAIERVADLLASAPLLPVDDLTNAVCQASRGAEAVTGYGAGLWREHFGRCVLELRAMILAIGGTGESRGA